MKPILRKLMIVGLIALPIVPVAFSGCVTTSSGEHGLEKLEAMSESNYQRMKLYSSLGIKIAANRLVKEGVLTAEELLSVANAIDAIKTTPVLGGAEVFVQDLLVKSGLTGAESQALLEIVVFELQDRGVFDLLSTDGTVVLAPRTQDFIDALVAAVKSATTVTQEEFKSAKAAGIAVE